MHLVLVNHLGRLSLPRTSVVRLTDSPDLTIAVYHGRKITTQKQQQSFTLSSDKAQYKTKFQGQIFILFYYMTFPYFLLSSYIKSNNKESH